MTTEKATHYRGFAQRMLAQARKAHTEEARQGFLTLASCWLELAEKNEAAENQHGKKKE
jgi:hypothetical protein